MAEAPIVETRRVVIEYVVNGPPWQKPSESSLPTRVTPELVEEVRKQLLLLARRNGGTTGLV